MNKRQLKKKINYVCGDMAAEILIARHLSAGFDDDKVAAVIGNIAELQVKTIGHTSFAFDKSERDFENRAAYLKAKHAYNRQAYKTLNAEFDKGVASIVKEMNAAMPQAVKDANKA